MSVKMMLMNIISDIENNKNSIENIIVSDQTQDDALSETNENIAALQENKQDKINVLSQINCNTISCNDLKIGALFIKSEIEKKADSSHLQQELTNLNSSLDNLQEQINNKAETTITDYLQSTVSDMSTNFLNKNLSETINEVCTFAKAPILDISSQILSDFSIVNKKYIDDKLTQVWNTINVVNYVDVTLRGVHTVDLNEFDLFVNSIPANTTVKIATFRFTTVNAWSRLNCVFNTPYRFPSGAASGSDSIRSYAQVYQGGVLKYTSYQPVQYFVGIGGGGSRSGTIFPLHFSVKRQILNGTEITMHIYIRNDSDDAMQVESTDGTFFTCNEIRG